MTTPSHPSKVPSEQLSPPKKTNLPPKFYWNLPEETLAGGVREIRPENFVFEIFE